MSFFNRTLLIGRVGAIRQLVKNDRIYARIAIYDIVHTPEGVTHNWFTVFVYDEQRAKSMLTSINRGDLVLIEGRIDDDRSIICEKVTCLSHTQKTKKKTA